MGPSRLRGVGRAGALYPAGRGFWTPVPAGVESGLRGGPGRSPGTLVPDPGPGGRRAPARGVDVKPPSRRGPGPVPGPCRHLGALPGPRGGLGPRNPGSRDLDSRDPEVPDRSRRPLQGPGGPPGPSAVGVDVKPPRQIGPGGPKRPQNPQKGGFTGKKAFFGLFWPKWPFLAILRKKCPVATGLKTSKNPKIGLFLQKGSETPGPGGPRAGVLHQPLAAGPCTQPGSRGPRRHVATSHSRPPRASSVKVMVGKHISGGFTLRTFI